MTKTELINSIADKANCTKKDASAALEATIAAIQETLETGEKVSITGFGTFERADSQSEGFACGPSKILIVAFFFAIFCAVAASGRRHSDTFGSVDGAGLRTS